MQQTLLMLHGLTGTAEMIEQFAKKISPEHCNLVVPNGTYKHEERGFCWWHYSIEHHKNKDNKIMITDKLLREVQKSINYLTERLPKDGKIILGGFSQGGAMAQIMLLSQISTRISGLVLLGTRSIEEQKLRKTLRKLKPIPVLWMHGLSDEIIKYEESIELVNIFEDEGWDVVKITHEKGHVIPLELHEDVKKFIQEAYSNNS